jgi:two-component system C4-dicarboxylate transport sensor histidine kinase DctB
LSPHREPQPLHPLRTAIALSILYLLLCSIYIVLSSAEAARVAESVVELRRFEQWKGLAFVAATGALFFALSWFSLERLARQGEVLARKRALLEAAEGPALVGSFSAAIAHDVNNALVVATGALALRDRADDAEQRARADERLRKALDDIGRITKRMARLGVQRDAPTRMVCDLAETVRETVDFGRRHPKIAGCRIEVEVPANLSAEIDRTLIGRALLNMLLNAAEATGGAGHLRVGLHHDDSDPRLAVIEVHDDGTGVEPARRDQIFDVFHTTKQDGTGLGLFSVRSAASAHDGEASVTDSALGGACFRIRFPTAPGTEPPGRGS